MSNNVVEHDLALASRIATAAARRLVELRAENSGTEPRRLKSIGDRGAQQTIAAQLDESAPQDAVLSEEAEDSGERIGADRVWIVDPLDGTREYSEGRDDWAVHVALVADGELTVGAVAVGGPERVLTSGDAALAARAADGPIRIAVSRTRPPELVRRVADTLGAELVPMGSAGVKICSVITGETDAYVHGGGQYEWDSAAPVAVARAAGLHTSRLDGSPLRYNRPDPYLPDLIVCRPELADRVVAAVRQQLDVPAE